jgi:hypothetical protein
MAVINLNASNILVMQGFAQAAFPAGRHLEIVSQSLNLQQVVVVVSTNQRPSNSLNLQQTVKVNKVIHLAASNTLPLYSQGAKARFLATSNLLRFTQSATRDKLGIAESILHFVQTVDVHKGLLNKLVLTQTVKCNVRRNLSASNQLVIVEGTVGFIDGNWQFVAVAEPALITNYDPSNLAIPPVPATPFPVVFIGNRNSLSFPIVEYGDTDRIEHTRINRRTLGEELIVFRDPRWPRTETLKFKLVDLTATQGKAMLSFMEDNLAQVIKLCDWLGVRWLGVITNPETMLMQPGRDQNCSGRYSLEIEFQGVQLGYTVNLSVSDQLVFSDGVVTA